MADEYVGKEDEAGGGEGDREAVFDDFAGVNDAALGEVFDLLRERIKSPASLF